MFSFVAAFKERLSIVFATNLDNELRWYRCIFFSAAYVEERPDRRGEEAPVRVHQRLLFCWMINGNTHLLINNLFLLLDTYQFHYSIRTEVRATTSPTRVNARKYDTCARALCVNSR